jgi:hypothetical protein
MIQVEKVYTILGGYTKEARKNVASKVQNILSNIKVSFDLDGELK